ADFRLRSLQSAKQKPWMAKNLVLQGGKRVFYDGLPQLHSLGCGALLHALQGVFVHVPFHQPPGSHGATRLERTAATDFRLTSVDDAAILSLMAVQALPRRAEVRIGGRVVLKLRAIKQGSIALIVNRAIGRHVGNNTLSFTRGRLFSIRISAISHHMEALPRP